MAARPLASLSSTLLARPGQAKPAMRPQVFAPQPLDDLGWNDMGTAPAAAAAVEPAVPASTPTPVPPVLTERAELAQAVAKPRPAATPTPATRPRGKAAFTLRLDADRHLRLRLASAVAGRSSQQLLVAALDAYLDSQPQVEAIARQVPAKSFSGEKQS